MLVAALINGTNVSVCVCVAVCVCVFSCTSHIEYQNSPGSLVGVEVGATVGVWVDNAPCLWKSSWRQKREVCVFSINDFWMHRHTVITHPAGEQGIYDWAGLHRIQMKRFSHWIHSYSLFILLGETETLPLCSERPPYPPKPSWAKETPFRGAEWTRTAYYDVISYNYKCREGRKVENRLWWLLGAFFQQVQGRVAPILQVEWKSLTAGKKTPCGGSVWVAGRTCTLATDNNIWDKSDVWNSICAHRNGCGSAAAL